MTGCNQMRTFYFLLSVGLLFAFIDMVLDGIPSGVPYTLTVRMVKPIPGSVSIEDVIVTAGEITDVLPLEF
jgi:hypothetical protein